MKKNSTLILTALLLTLLALFTPRQAQAQDDNVVGYTNVYVRVKAVPEDGGRVFASLQQSGLTTWKTEQDFKQVVPVSLQFYSYVSAFFLKAQPTRNTAYTFGGWYLDDGDGVFDIERDELLSQEADDYLHMSIIDEDDPNLYETQAQARAAGYPEEPTDIIFAYFTQSAQVSTSFWQDDYFPHGDCGSVWISKQVNEPGEQVTVRAIPTDGYHFEYWKDQSYLGNVVSRENPYTFTVQGGEHLYAYFVADDAPEFDLPEEGGFAVFSQAKTWVLHDESILAGAVTLYPEAEDMVRTADGKAYLDMTKDEARDIFSLWQGQPTILYGKGKVRFAYNVGMGMYAEKLLKWSGTSGATVSDELTYVYIFVPELGAFIKHGSTDNFDDSYSPTVQVPAGLCFFTMSAYDLADGRGDIPSVIGLSPESYDRGVAEGKTALDKLLSEVAGIEGVRLDSRTLQGRSVYTLSGVEVKTTPERGVYIVNGRKVVLK